MKENFNLKQEAHIYFTRHYPHASNKEIEKQIEDWEHKAESSKKLVDFFQERVGKVIGKKVLDVGFGSGGIAIAFVKGGALVSGVDVDPELKIIADKNAETQGVNIDFKIYNGAEFPFPDNYFEYSTSSSVLEHVTFPEKILSEMLRVVKPGGRILLTLPNKWAPKETHTLAYFVSYMPRGLAEIYLRLLKRSSLKDDNLHFYSYFDVVRMLKKSPYTYEILYKNINEMKGLKRVVARFLKKFNIHYTAFLRQLIFVIEKK